MGKYDLQTGGRLGKAHLEAPCVFLVEVVVELGATKQRNGSRVKWVLGDGDHHLTKVVVSRDKRTKGFGWGWGANAIVLILDQDAERLVHRTGCTV